MAKKKPSYFNRTRIISLVIWFISLFTLPWLIVKIGLLPAGTEFVIAFLVLTSIFALLFDKVSFQVGVITVIIMAAFSLFQPTFLRQVIDDQNNGMQDAFYVLRGPKKPTKQVVIVDIDQRSLEAVGQWPWPRTETARVIKNLRDDGARVICFDIVYAEPGRYSMKDWVERLSAMGIEMKFPGMDAEQTRQQIENEDWDFAVSGKDIKEVALTFWERTFERLDPDFFVETEDPKERELVLVNKYIEYDKHRWDIDQEHKGVELASAGHTHEHEPYIAPERPLLAMTRETSELFFIDSNWNSEAVFEKGASIVMDNDVALGEAYGDAPVIAGGLFILGGRTGSVQLAEAQAKEGMVLSSPVWNAEDVFYDMREADDQILNIPEIQERTNYQGMFNIVPDKSGAARFYTMMLKAPVYEDAFVAKEGVDMSGAAALDPDNYEMKVLRSTQVYPAIAMQMLRVANGYNRAEATVRNGQKGLLLTREERSRFGTDALMKELGGESRAFKYLLEKERFIPLDFKGDLRINFLGYGGKWQPDAKFGADYHIPYVSISDVLHKRFEPGTFQDKYIILGSTDPTLSDLVGSPFRPAFPGLEVHATMLENLITEDYIIDLGDKGTFYSFLGILIGGLILTALIAFTGPWIAAFFMGSVMILLPSWSFYGLAYGGYIVEFVYPWLCTAFLGIIVILVNFFIEGQEKRFINATFKNYLSPELIDQMVESGTTPQLGGTEGVLTAYFTDIQSFSTFSEKLGSPTKLVELLNEYLSAMTDILLEKKGTLDKYEGDAIIAFFGAPMPLENHALSSCYAALSMQDKLIELRHKWESEGDKWPKIVHDMRMRIGINSGPIVTGNMGSAIRMNYTMMGDTVNLAARLESGAKQYGVFTFCSGESYELTGDVLLVRFIDSIRVVGKSLPVKTYELLHKDKTRAPMELRKLVDKFALAIEAYKAMEWDNAIALFEECLPLEPHHPDWAPGCKTCPSLVFIARCKEYKENPPVAEGETWDGVYTATSK